MPIISGTVFDDSGNPVAGRIVRAYRRDTGELLGWTLSSDGSSDPHWDKVVSLLHFDGVNGSTSFIDETGRLWTAKGGAIISSEQAKFGNTSGKFFGVGSRIDTAPTLDFSFGTGDFTVEGWIYVGPPPGGGVDNDRSIFGAFDFNPDMNFFLDRRDNAPSLWDGNTAPVSSIPVPTNKWSHFAFVRESGVLRMFVDGVMGYQGALTTNFNSTAVADIGSERAASRPLNGYLDSFRITKGVARYTANFTPPTAPFPETATPLPLGKYEITTTYTGECNVICLDDSEGTTYNDLILRTIPA